MVNNKTCSKVKILFLDIDGVLNSIRYFNKHKPTDIYWFDPSCISNLRLLLEKVPELRIVISSSWRRYLSLRQLKSKFKKDGIPNKFFIGVTDTKLSSISREMVIHQWLAEHRHTGKFAIVDDIISDFSCIDDSFFHINPIYGLTKKDIKRLVSHLNSL